MCAGRADSLQTAIDKMTSEFRLYTNANFSMISRRSAIDTMVNIIDSDLGKWSDVLAQCSQQLYVQICFPPSAVGVLPFLSYARSSRMGATP